MSSDAPKVPTQLNMSMVIEAHGVVRTGQVKILVGASSVNTIKKMVREGLLTPPYETSPRDRAWPVREIIEINAAKAAGASPDEVRAIVKQLVDERPKGSRVLNEIRARALESATQSYGVAA